MVLTQLGPLLLATLVAGLGAALSGPLLSAAYLDITSHEHRSRIMALKGSAAGLGGVAGPLLVAVASQYLPAQAIFGISAALAVLGALIALLVLGDRLDRSEQPGILPTSARELEPHLAEAGAIG